MSRHNVSFFLRKYARIVLHQSVRVTSRAPRRSNFWVHPGVSRLYNQELWQRKQTGSTMCEKRNYDGSRTFIRPHLLKRNPSHAVRTHKAPRGSKNKWEDKEEATRAASCASASLQRVKESRWQQQTGTWKTQCQAQKTGNIKQTTAWAIQKEGMDAKIQTPGPCRTTMNLKQGRWTLPRTASKHFTDASFPGTWKYLRPWPRLEEHRAMPLWQRTQAVPSCAKKIFQRGRCRVPRHETAWRTFQIVGGQWVGKKAAATEAYAPYENLSMKMAVVTTTHLSSQPRRWLTLGKRRGPWLSCPGCCEKKRGGNGASTASSRPRSISSTCWSTSIMFTKTCT